MMFTACRLRCSCARGYIASSTRRARKRIIEQVVKQAAVGIGGSSAYPMLTQLANFVVAWSGGKDGRWLKNLEAHERSCTIKRKSAASDLGYLAELDLLHGARYMSVTWYVSFRVVFGTFDV